MTSWVLVVALSGSGLWTVVPLSSLRLIWGSGGFMSVLLVMGLTVSAFLDALGPHLLGVGVRVDWGEWAAWAHLPSRAGPAISSWGRLVSCAFGASGQVQPFGFVAFRHSGLCAHSGLCRYSGHLDIVRAPLAAGYRVRVRASSALSNSGRWLSGLGRCSACAFGAFGAKFSALFGTHSGLMEFVRAFLIPGCLGEFWAFSGNLNASWPFGR